VRLGDPPLERGDPRRLPLAVRDPGEREHRADMGAVAGADLLHRARRIDVIVAIGQAEAPLQQVRRVAIRLIEVLRDPQAEQVLGIEVGRVQRIDVGPQAAADPGGERGPIGNCRHEVQQAADRLEPLPLDRPFVHVAGVVIGHLARGRIRGDAAAGETLDQFARVTRRLFAQIGPDARTGAVGRNLGALQPRAVRERMEIVAGADGPIHSGDVDVVRRRGLGAGGTGSLRAAPGMDSHDDHRTGRHPHRAMP
jgi:hypothetical protein